MAASGAVDTSTALTDAFSGSNIRSVASTNGADLWVSGNGTLSSSGGIRYTTLGATSSTQLSTTVINLRNTYIYNGQLYISTSSGSAVRIGTVGSGTPTTSGQTITNLPGFPTTGSPYGFLLLDLDSGVAGVDTLYVADDTSPGAITKYSLVAGNWVSNGSIAVTGVRGLTGKVTSGAATLYATSATNFYAYTDTAGYNMPPSGTATSLVVASTNTAFRGIAFAPATPLAVTLANFEAAGSVDRVAVTWETVSEVDNAGFNLYRADSAAGALTLVATLASQAPGSTQGASYRYQDTAVQAGRTYWYTLEDVSLSGAATLHGPVSATVQAPTAVTLTSVTASPAAGVAALTWLVVMVSAGVALSLGRRR